MEAWTFTHPDTWTPTEGLTWGDNEQVDAFMARLGYGYEGKARNAGLVDFLGSWRLYLATDASNPTRHALLVEGVDGCCVIVWVPTFPDLLAYMARYGEIGQSEWNQIEWDAMRDTVKRAFRAWHGHDAASFCRECDPESYARWQQQKTEKRARVAQAHNLREVTP